MAEHYLAPETVTLFRDESNNVNATVSGRGEWSKVGVKRAFPYSDPHHYIALTQNGDHVGMIRDPQEMDERSRELLQEMLQKRYHIPRITRIVSVDGVHNATMWHVETDKGERRFLVRDRHGFRRVGPGVRIVLDVDGNRYRIPPPRELDRQSRRLLDLHA